jgi:predicted RNA binding protein YcfA (HicA-like mRNA interferase family)
MPDGFYNDVVRELRRLGYEYAGNAKGSHEKWEHGSSGRRLIVPRNMKSRHTANAILKASGSDLHL